MITMTSHRTRTHHLDCGCRPSTVRRRGHRPACVLFDFEAAASRRSALKLRRRWEEAATGWASMDHAPGVILAV